MSYSDPNPNELGNIQIAPPPDERAEFYRDAEASNRVMTPYQAHQFLLGLCEAQARKEILGVYKTTPFPLAVLEDRIQAKSRALYVSCLDRGCANVPLTYITIDTTIAR